VRLLSEIVNQSGMPWLLLFYVLFLVGIPALVVWGVISLFRSNGNRNPVPPDPEQILKTRLARGEIDTEEYERLRGFIRSDR
jgi:uncharacterized membrane protein